MKKFKVTLSYLILLTLLISGCNQGQESILNQQENTNTYTQESEGRIELGTDIVITGASSGLKSNSQVIAPDKLKDIDGNITEAKELTFINLNTDENIELTFKINDTNRNILKNIDTNNSKTYVIAQYTGNTWKAISDFYPSTSTELKANIVLDKDTMSTMIIAVREKENLSSTLARSTGSILETFDNLALSGSSYVTGSFQGTDSIGWNYVYGRIDSISGKAIMLGKGKTPSAELKSDTISGGIGTLKFDYKQAFSSNVNLNVMVNDTLVATVTTYYESGVSKSSGNIDVNVTGDFVIRFVNTSSSAGQVTIDNVQWTSNSGGDSTTDDTSDDTTTDDNTTDGTGNDGNNTNNGEWGEPQDYYSSISNQKGEALKAALNDIIDNHTELSYSGVWTALQKTDQDPNNPNNVILIYTGNSVNGPKTYDSGNGWNREHVWAKSHGDFGTSKGPGTDLHHLRPADIYENSSRSNKEFDDRTTSSTYEPRDEVKGDVARMIFYMATRYEGEHGEVDLEVIENVTDALRNPTHGKLSTLLEWHKADPVDDWERRRNQVIYTEYQHNRNPFIDHPEWVSAIWEN